MAPISEDRRSGIDKLISLFSTVALKEEPNQWRNLARSLAIELRTPEIDWRDLVRALERIRPNVDSPATSILLDRASFLAMRLADLSAPPRASAEMLDACAPDVAPEDMLRAVIPILKKQIPFDLVSYVEYYHAADGTTLVRGRFAMDRDAEFLWPARWVEVPGDIARWQKVMFDGLLIQKIFTKITPRRKSYETTS